MIFDEKSGGGLCVGNMKIEKGAYTSESMSNYHVGSCPLRQCVVRSVWRHVRIQWKPVPLLRGGLFRSNRPEVPAKQMERWYPILQKHQPSLQYQWINYHMSSEVWYEITYQFLYFNSCTVEVEELISTFTPYFIGHALTYPYCDCNQSVLVERYRGGNHCH